MKMSLVFACAALACASAPAIASGGGGTTTTGGSGGGGTTATGGSGGGGGGLPNLVLNPGFQSVANPNGHTDWEPWNIGYYALYKGTGFNGYTAFTPCKDVSCLLPDNIVPGTPWDRCTSPTELTTPDCTSPYLVQAIATTPGTRYDVSFEVAEDAGPNSGFAFYWDGQLVAVVANPANNTLPVFGTQQPDAKKFIKFSYPGLLATTSSTTFEFKGYQENGEMFFGNPIVTLSRVQ
jgi:hypothetical protein